MSSQQFCTAHFTISVSKENDDHLIIATADNDQQITYTAPIVYFLSHYDDTSLAGPNNHIVSSEHNTNFDGVCDVNPILYPQVYEKNDASDIAVTLGLNTVYLPHQHKISQNYTNYAFSIFASHNGSYVFPGYKTTFTLPMHDEDIKDVVILYK